MHTPTQEDDLRGMRDRAANERPGGGAMSGSPALYSGKDWLYDVVAHLGLAMVSIAAICPITWAVMGGDGWPAGLLAAGLYMVTAPLRLLALHYMRALRLRDAP